ncbi:MAG: UDP-N-acetylmuramoyl-tripeptide--D-alanyl-D-alanine ligase [Candidatus Puniceispirillaceae bacterium]
MITNWTASDLAQITSGIWHGPAPVLPLEQVEIDHRNLDKTGLFIALKGNHHDGHDFVADLTMGHCALVSRQFDGACCAQLKVPDTLSALHDIAKAAMAQTTAKKIAITGSVGKTSTKEALDTILSCYGNCHASRGNYNNHIGAPLSMARTPDDCDLIVMEMGMNHKGEISPLSYLYHGDVAIITKIANSHIGHFDSLGDIACAKAEIFDGMTDGTAILPYDDAHFDILRDKAKAKGLHLITFGTGKGADIQLIKQASLEKGQSLSLYNHLSGESLTFTLGLSAPHHATTAMIAIATLHALSLPWQMAETKLAQLQEVTGRGDQSFVNLGQKTALFINDSYNAGPASMAASLQHIASLTHAKKGIVLTDMLELGHMSDEAHQSLIPLIRATGPQRLILIGPAMSALASSIHIDGDISAFGSADEAKDKLHGLLADCDLILIKGSNGSGAPQMARLLSALTIQNDKAEAHDVT